MFPDLYPQSSKWSIRSKMLAPPEPPIMAPIVVLCQGLLVSSQAIYVTLALQFGLISCGWNVYRASWRDRPEMNDIMNFKHHLWRRTGDRARRSALRIDRASGLMLAVIPLHAPQYRLRRLSRMLCYCLAMKIINWQGAPMHSLLLCQGVGVQYEILLSHLTETNKRTPVFISQYQWDRTRDLVGFFLATQEYPYIPAIHLCEKPEIQSMKSFGRCMRSSQDNRRGLFRGQDAWAAGLRRRFLRRSCWETPPKSDNKPYLYSFSFEKGPWTPR